ncbi:transducin family protein/WD-40 repeat family protein [Forsythia ovata]|uniref:Transducin family protein/WD-40 repeat family protein n=1 Tax=Forsythia ovata TaxID=205694 RepID=A0ABD1X435_9LAMI
MQFVAELAAINSMGYSFSKLEIDSGLLDGLSSNNEVEGSSQSKSLSNHLDHEIAQLTKLRSGPHVNLSRVLPGKRRLPVSTYENVGGSRGKFYGKRKVLIRR